MTHPHPPLVGRQVEVIRLRRGSEPDLIVRRSDGPHAASAGRWSDYATLPNRQVPASAVPLLALAGLRQIVHRLDCLRAEHRGPRAGSTS